MTYEYICTKCGAISYSAAEISVMKYNRCWYCNGEIDYTEEQKEKLNKLKNSKLEKSIEK